MSSQVLRGPTPMREIISRPSLTLATALPETAAGMEGIFFGSSAASMVAAHSTRAMKTGSFFMARDITAQSLVKSDALGLGHFRLDIDRIRHRLWTEPIPPSPLSDPLN